MWPQKSLGFSASGSVLINAANQAELENAWMRCVEKNNMSKRKRRTARSLLYQIRLHEVKLTYSASTDCRAHWEGEIYTFTKQLNELIVSEPSLASWLDSIAVEIEKNAKDAYGLLEAGKRRSWE